MELGAAEAASSNVDLVKHRERSAEAPRAPSPNRCIRPAKGLRWRLADGTLSPLRCGAPNRCDYCAKLVALENALVVRLDAALHCPTVGITTTTRDPDFDMARLRKAEASLWRALRERYPQLRYLGFLEWTSGKHAKDRRRRPHVHHLVKGLPPEEAAELEATVRRLWKRYTSDAWRCDCRELRTPAGAIAYLALHHHKMEQAPPRGFKGKRLRPSTKTATRPGYFEIPVAELRELARRQLADGRLAWAVGRTIDVELYGRGEFEADGQLTEALAAALLDLAKNPLELQLGLDGSVDQRHELAELVRRTVEEARRLRAASPPALVKVREREILDRTTGEILGSEVVAELGELAVAA